LQEREVLHRKKRIASKEVTGASRGRRKVQPPVALGRDSVNGRNGEYKIKGKRTERKPEDCL